ncbi:MAG TPA: D-glycero-beta-D-manno-heptose-7-phosphate kinase [Rickettsiales bacterium]|nr:D-glycero-beta-D-manno-heptose-7-phosphate kinase [Rickettsiales bacterium]
MSDYYNSVVDNFGKIRILCVGDIMLDQFVYGVVERISPEAPIPVFGIKEEKTMLGGAGNVMRNIVSLGANTVLVSVIGHDKVGHDIASMIGQERNVLPYMLTESNRLTTTKTRYVAGSHQVLRADKEVVSAISEDTERRVLDAVASELDNVDAIILSDYGKGLLTRAVLQGIISAAKAKNKPVIVDPKSRDFGVYAGATLISPNLHELSVAAHRELKNEADIISAAKALIQSHDLEHILVTRSKDGMSLVSRDGNVHHIPARAHEVFDVSGAGDTAIATLALGIASGMPLLDSAILANTAAGVVVGKLGTATIAAQDLKTELFVQEKTGGTHKILMLEDAIVQVEKWKREGRKVGFTNGCFDLIHSGHLAILNRTKSHCDRLIVALNSDASVKRLKGESRPVNSEMERALLLASLSVVDMVVIFGEDTPMRLLEALRPDVLAKGADYQKHQVVGHELVESYGGEVVLVPLKEGYSTTNIIKKLVA